MADQLRLRGGDTATSATFVGALREVTVDTGLKRLRLHDGVTPGGHILAAKIELDDAVAALNQTIIDNEEADAKARADLKTLLEEEIAEQEELDSQARQALQAAIDAEVAASAAYDVIQDNRLAVLEAVNNISKKELDFITLVGNAAPNAGEVGVNSLTPTGVQMIVLPKTDANGTTVTESDFLQGDRIALKQANGSAAIFYVDDAFDFDPHIRIVVDQANTILGAAGDQAFEADAAVQAVFEDTSVTRGAATAGFAAEATAREEAVASLTTLITALQDRATALETDSTTKSYVDTQISTLIGGAPDALNQLNEIIAAFESADTDLINDLAGIGVRVTALEADPTTQTYVNSVRDAEQAARIAADAATLTSANSYTDTQVASGDATVTTNLTALVTTETNTRAAADTALSDRLAVLEADPTTATALTAAVAGVQADVDQNEADADTAISAEETRALAAEAAITAAQAAEEAARNQLNLHAGLAFGQLYVGDLIVA